MTPTILLYNFSPARTALANKALLPYKCAVISVSEKDQIQKIGFMLGENGFEKQKPAVTQRSFKDELIVISGISSDKLSLLLISIRSVLGQIDYKALVTDTNINWTGIQLFTEIKHEHKQFNSQCAIQTVQKPTI